ncbi:MAG: hypothetical protein ACTHLN_10225, partial [Tepidisphaeraceae bacterium]
AEPLYRLTVSLTPAAPLLMPPQPWNIYPIDGQNQPAATRGIVHATQRGSAMGCLFFSITEPSAGTCFYLQNLTALNAYCRQNRTRPEGVVGHNWPGMGFTPPPSDEHALAAGREVSLCDAFVRLSDRNPANNRESAAFFLDATAKIYRHLDLPPTAYRDWPAKAAATVRDLSHSSKCSLEQQGHLYLHPYVSSEYPDSMVQLSVLLAVDDYARWSGSAVPIRERLRAAVPNFFDPKLGILRRYLATVGSDKDADQSDSWYVYHPLMNLGRLALAGDPEAKQLFLRCLEYGIRIARHFHYVWPVMFNVATLEVIRQNRKPGEAGQTDVGGLYAYVMIQAFTLTGDRRYLAEAEAAIRALADLGFSVGYQFNTVAWGIVACLQVFKIGGDRFFLEQANVLLASFFHNVNLWESELGPAKHYPIFMGVTCLHDGPYMAAYEEFEAYAAFHEALQVAGDELPASVRFLITEYCRHALNRGWFYYPASLPAEALATEIRNGHIDRSLAIPLEDLYADRRAPGSVGQEVYGAGLSPTLLSRSHHRHPKMPFTLFCEGPLRKLECDRGMAMLNTWGEPDQVFACRLLPNAGVSLPLIRRRFDSMPCSTPGDPSGEDQSIRFNVPAGEPVILEWD